MSLEKIMIFGLALSVMTAVAIFAGGTAETRETQETGYRDGVAKIVEQAE